MAHRQLSLGLLLALVVVPARAGVLVVDKTGQGDFSSLTAALEAATDGDILLLKHSTSVFAPSHTALPDKSLTLVADGGSVTLVGMSLATLSSDRTLVLEGLTISNGLRLANAAGAVRLVNCDCSGKQGLAAQWNPVKTGLPGEPAITLVGCANVALTRCELVGGLGGLLDDDSYQSHPTPGGPGLQVDASLATIADCNITGGTGGLAIDGGENGADGGVGIVNLSGALVLMGDDTEGGSGSSGDLNGFGDCGLGGNGGDALHTVESGALTWLRGVTLHGGHPGSSACSSGGDGSWGQLSVTDAGDTNHLSAEATGFLVDSPVREQELVTLTIAGQPGDVAFTWLSLQSGYALLPKYEGTLLVASPVATLLLGVVPASQRLDVPAVIPELGPGVEGVVIQMQSFVQRSGNWLLGPSTVLVALDAAL